MLLHWNQVLQKVSSSLFAISYCYISSAQFVPLSSMINQIPSPSSNLPRSTDSSSSPSSLNSCNLLPSDLYPAPASCLFYSAGHCNGSALSSWHKQHFSQSICACGFRAVHFSMSTCLHSLAILLSTCTVVLSF